MIRTQAEDTSTAIIEATARYFRAVQMRLPTEAPGVGGVTREQWYVLLEVVKAGAAGLTMGELAGRQGMALNSASALVERLVNAGYLERRDEPTDRRVVRVTATPAGVELRTAIAEARRLEYERLLTQLSPENLAALRAALPALIQLADAATQAGRR